MKIEFCAFDSRHAQRIIREITPFLAGTVVFSPSGTADITVVAINGEQSLPFVKAHDLSHERFVLFVIMNLSETVIPYLKCADHTIWFSPAQERVVTGLLNLSYPGEISVVPITAAAPADQRNDLFIYVGESFDPELIPWFEQCVSARNWFPCDNGTIRILFNNTTPFEKSFEQFKNEQLEQIGDPRVEILSTDHSSDSEIEQWIAQSHTGEYFKREIDETMLENLIASQDSALLYIPLETDWIVEQMAAAGLQSSMGISGINRSILNTPHAPETFKSFADRIIRISEQVAPKCVDAKKNRRYRAEVDTYETLHVVHGKPLTNDFVFSICFRNQSKKILRALDSILAQKGDFDFGIAIVDDCSTDGSTDLILNHLKECSVDWILVSNEKRRFTARNFYNVCNFLTANENAVLIELDGDDYLNGDQVLAILNREYQRGMVKTSGSLITLPEDSDMGRSFVSQQQFMDFSQPWNISACNSWLMLRTCKLSLIRQLELDYFLNRRTGDWLQCRHDSITQSRIIELAGADRCVHIKEPLYVYDISGDDHIHGGSDVHDRSADQIKMFRNLDTLYRPYSLR